MYQYISYRELFEQAEKPNPAKTNLKNSAILLSLTDQDQDKLVDLSRSQSGKTKEAFIRPAELVNDKNPEEVRGNITVVILAADADTRDAVFPEPPAEKENQLILQLYPKQLGGISNVDQGPVTLPVRVVKDDPKSAINLIFTLAGPDKEQAQEEASPKEEVTAPEKKKVAVPKSDKRTEAALKTGELTPNESKTVKSFDRFISEEHGKK